MHAVLDDLKTCKILHQMLLLTAVLFFCQGQIGQNGLPQTTKLHYKHHFSNINKWLKSCQKFWIKTHRKKSFIGKFRHQRRRSRRPQGHPQLQLHVPLFIISNFVKFFFLQKNKSSYVAYILDISTKQTPLCSS